MQKLPCRWVCPKKGQRRSRSQQGLNGVAQSDHVLVFINRRTVHKLDGGQLPGLNWAVRQALKPFQILGSELIAGPQRRQSGDGIEVLQVHRPTGRLVMVSAHKDVPQSARALDHFVRARTVADDVPEVDHHVVCRGCCQARFESFQVAMNIAYEKNAHGSPDKVGIIDLSSQAVR